MGKNINFCCKTCKKNYYIGYGSYDSWLTGCAKTLKEYSELKDMKEKQLIINKNYHECLKVHNSHDFFTWSSENYSVHDGKLIFEGAYKSEIMIEDFDKYKLIDLSKITPLIQLDEWVDGHPIHDYVLDQCCPDFSCCTGNIVSLEIRKRFQKAFVEKDEETKMTLLGSFLGIAFSKQNIYVAGDPANYTPEQ